MNSFHGLKEGDEVEVEIKELARDGRGIARIRGLLLFVDGCKVGSKVRVKITKMAARHAHATVVQTLEKR